MYVGNFLELERAVHGHGIMNGAAQEQEVLHLVIFFRQLPASPGRGLQQHFHLARQIEQFANVLSPLLLGKLASHLSQVKRKQVEHRHLRRESLGGSDADLGSGVSVEHTIGLARDGRIDHI
jgi:hypothetical protein